jgi:Heparinase II/III-like protein/Heparinase II/III N-terminus
MKSPTKLGWYARRLRRMSPGEIAWRFREQAVRRAWARRQVRRDGLLSLSPLPKAERRFTAILPPGVAARVPEQAKAAVVADASRLLKGEWELLSVVRTDMEHPDWFYDPVTGRRSAPDAYAFSLDQRDETAVGNVKQVWEINRLQHLTVLAVAWYLTAEDAYAQRVADQLNSWWRENPFLSGINWTSGIEVGVRLINFAWIRRLLDGWPGVADLFEHNDLAVRQIRWHQEYLAAFESKGSSANNHVIAEAAGQLAAACAFPWFPESGRWRDNSTRLLERELAHNTFPSGINRELASDYHGFVAELGFFAAIEAAAAGAPLSDATWRLLCAMTDCMAALVDEQMRPPRQADSDEGRVVLLDAPEHNRWPALLSLGDALFGRLDWWPAVPLDAGAVFSAALVGAEGNRRVVSGRPSVRPNRFPDAGLSVLRTDSAVSPELWVRCDGGPHGFLAIAAHAHADALSVEIRYGGVDILADPGTYCYHGEPEWRSYFKSTIAHNTVEIGGQSQSADGGPFLWTRHARTRELDVPDRALQWAAEHDGYQVISPKAAHRRSVRLDPGARAVDIIDVIDGGGHEVKMAYHFGPLVHVSLRGRTADLSWPEAAVPGQARFALPAGLNWRAYQGSADPIMGWYSAGLGHKTPAVTLIGSGRCQRDAPLTTRLEFVGIVTQTPASDAQSGLRESAEHISQGERIRSLRHSPANRNDEADIAAEASL